LDETREFGSTTASDMMASIAQNIPVELRNCRVQRLDQWQTGSNPTKWKSPVPDRSAANFGSQFARSVGRNARKSAELLISARASPEIFSGF
jgi:hypothetical protein